jgi:AsmA family protein
VVYGDGTINLATEAIDLYFRPYPKDKSLLSLRSPLKLTGTLGAPNAGPDKGALAGRAAAALALGAINPLLALAATVETGPGEDANCGAILRQAAAGGPNTAVAGNAQANSERGQNQSKMGAPAAAPGQPPRGADQRSPADNAAIASDPTASQDPAATSQSKAR